LEKKERIAAEERKELRERKREALERKERKEAEALEEKETQEAEALEKKEKQEAIETRKARGLTQERNERGTRETREA